MEVKQMVNEHERVPDLTSSQGNISQNTIHYH